MKLNNKLGILTTSIALSSTAAYAVSNEALYRGLGDWISLVAEVLSFVCLFIFITYVAKYLFISKNKGSASGNASAEYTKVETGLKNGIMTGLVGIALCQAVIIVAQIVMVK